MSCIRKNYFQDKQVVIAPRRNKRPHNQFGIKNICPFCAIYFSDKNILDALPRIKKWQVASIANLFPAFSKNNPRAYGFQEVIIDTPKHDQDFCDLSIRQIENILKMYAKRTHALSQDSKIQYILCFKNSGAKAGASLKHAHSQIIATGIIPSQARQEMDDFKKYQAKNKICPYCDILKKEAKTKRQIYSDRFISVLAPYTSEYGYETWILTQRHLDNITELNNQELKAVAQALKKITLSLKKLNLDFNFFCNQIKSETDQHFYFKIQPRPSVWAGLEMGSGLIINAISPEKAAKIFKKEFDF